MALSLIVDAANISSAVTGATSCIQASLIGQRVDKKPCQISTYLAQTIHNLQEAFNDLREYVEIIEESNSRTLHKTCDDWKIESEKEVPRKKRCFLTTVEYKAQLKVARGLAVSSEAVKVEISAKSASEKIDQVPLNVQQKQAQRNHEEKQRESETKRWAREAKQWEREDKRRIEEYQNQQQQLSQLTAGMLEVNHWQ
ncbi:hypothetical protein H0H87_008006 [Tephrocybe sp. NHM501043]|nr:hypothetical protein H0H87_008006 [Tephrocybe sp. NHM501043]